MVSNNARVLTPLRRDYLKAKRRARSCSAGCQKKLKKTRKELFRGLPKKLKKARKELFRGLFYPERGGPEKELERAGPSSKGGKETGGKKKRPRRNFFRDVPFQGTARRVKVFFFF